MTEDKKFEINMPKSLAFKAKFDVDKMNGYVSPISLDYETIVDTFAKAVSDDFDNAVFMAISKADIKVDKDELIRALNYDRDSYSTGYDNGFRNGIRAVIETLTEALDDEDEDDD